MEEDGPDDDGPYIHVAPTLKALLTHPRYGTAPLTDTGCPVGVVVA